MSYGLALQIFKKEISFVLEYLNHEYTITDY